jgi:hypothetical protein
MMPKAKERNEKNEKLIILAPWPSGHLARRSAPQFNKDKSEFYVKKMVFLGYKISPG